MKDVYVTRPSLPELKEFTSYLEKIWESKWLTNDGPFHNQLEKELAEYLGVKYISLISNGTLALIIALKALDIEGEVITTPFSFVATTHALWWNGIKPVFSDIERDSYNLDPEKIISKITTDTKAILPVHVYGNPCNVEKIEKISKEYNLKVLYDAAHAFGVKKNNSSILNFGDLSILSFHATKVFSTLEGGAIISRTSEMKTRIDNLKNFGIVDEETVTEPGINAKMNEIQASFGLLELKYLGDAIKKRGMIYKKYLELLGGTPGLYFNHIQENVEYNYAYFPVRINPDLFGIDRDGLYNYLKTKNIFARKYFYPLISRFPFYKNLPSANPDLLPIAEKVSREILCFPIYPDLTLAEVRSICTLIKESLSNNKY